MEIQTMSIVVGGPGCNAKCPYCISKQTGLDEVKGKYLPTCNRNLYSKDARVLSSPIFSFFT